MVYASFALWIEGQIAPPPMQIRWLEKPMELVLSKLSIKITFRGGGLNDIDKPANLPFFEKWENVMIIIIAPPPLKKGNMCFYEWFSSVGPHLYATNKNIVKTYWCRYRLCSITLTKLNTKYSALIAWWNLGYSRQLDVSIFIGKNGPGPFSIKSFKLTIHIKRPNTLLLKFAQYDK